MARPVRICDERILRAAREVFLERGHRATTAEVARRAEVSEGSLYHRFKTKQGLFRAAMQINAEPPAWVAHLHAHLDDDDLAATLEHAARLALDYFRTVIPYSMMAWSDPDSQALSEDRPHTVEGNRRLAGLFERQIERGRLRRFAPDSLLRAFVGPIANYATMETLRRGEQQPAESAERFLREHVELFLNGAAVGAGE